VNENIIVDYFLNFIYADHIIFFEEILLNNTKVSRVKNFLTVNRSIFNIFQTLDLKINIFFKLNFYTNFENQNIR
jgi:hypothetical protein